MGSRKQFAVLGLGRFGLSAARTLEEMGAEVLGVDMDVNLTESLTGTLSQVVSFDIRDARGLDQVGIGNFDAVIIALKNLEASLMATMLCKERGVTEIVVKAIDERHAEMARRLGATQIVFSERDMARRTVMHLVSKNAVDYIDLAGSVKIISIIVPESLVGKSLIESDLRRRYNIVVIAIRHGAETMVAPAPSYCFAEGDNLFIIGTEQSLAELERDL